MPDPKKRLNATQKMTGKWLKDAGDTFPKKGENHLDHIKRLTSPKAKTSALTKKMVGGSTAKAHRSERHKYGSDYNDMSGASEGDR